MTKDEALKLARRAILFAHDDGYKNEISQEAITAIREALAQPEQNQFNPDWDAMAVMVEEQQRMAKRIAELEAQRKPLTDVTIWNTYKNLWMFHPAEEPRLAGDVLKFARAIEQAHGIKGPTS